jgi:predicted TIM-barrel fold metal-dependent hydrolase
MERYPELLVVHPHCGGVLPYLMPRVVEQTEVKGRGRDLITNSPDTYYRRVYLDLVSPSVQAIRYAYEFSRPDRLLFGSDRPWVKIETFLELFDQLDIPEKDRRRMMGENACELFGIK